MKMKLPPLLLALALSACVQPGVTANRTVEPDKVPVVEYTRLTYDVRFDAGDRLPDAQARALEQYLGTIGVAYGDRIAVDDPETVGAAARRGAIAEVVARYGLLLDGSVPATVGRLAPGTARVIITRSRASIPNCPDWSRPSEYEVEAATSSNYGCATRSNLAEMIADPNDLVVGKSYIGADGQTASGAITSLNGPAPASSASPDSDASSAPPAGVGSILSGNGTSDN